MGASLTSGIAAMGKSTHGTVKDHSPFDPEEDAKTLRESMQGLGTDEKAIINTLGHRSNKQRQEIIEVYKNVYERDLTADLESEIGGNFESLVVALMMKPRNYDVYCLERAMNGVGTDNAVLIEILTSRSNSEINEIKELYKQETGKDLENELESETIGHFSKFLVALAKADRSENPVVSPCKARWYARALYEAGEKKWGTDESIFNTIMVTRSLPQLRATFTEYHKIAGHDIVKSIESEFSGNIESGLKAIVETTRSPPAYFASRLHKAMSGGGTDDYALIRIIVSRSEIDMVEIKQIYQDTYDKTLVESIQDETGGDYEALLKILVGP